MNHNDMNILDKKYKSPIEFLGQPRELAKTTKRVKNEIVYLLKKDAQIGKIEDPEEYKDATNQWIEEVKTFVKKLISPITDEELEFIEEDDLVDIIDAIERRKSKARGMTDEDIDILEQANRKEAVEKAKRKLQNPVEDEEDFLQTKSTDQDTNTGKQSTTED